VVSAVSSSVVMLIIRISGDNALVIVLVFSDYLPDVLLSVLWDLMLLLKMSMNLSQAVCMMLVLTSTPMVNLYQLKQWSMKPLTSPLLPRTTSITTK